LEGYFWLPPNADDARALEVFRNGFYRTEAVARRKLLAHPASAVWLTGGDIMST
jgi:hypothetical protein